MWSRKEINRQCPVLPTALLGLAVFNSLFLLTTGVSYAGDIVGVVQDPTLQQFVEGASVTVDEGNLRAVTDRWGRYSLRGLAAGEYTVEATAEGYQQQSLPVTVSETGEVVLDISLNLAYLDEITVTESRRAYSLLL